MSPHTVPAPRHVPWHAAWVVMVQEMVPALAAQQAPVVGVVGQRFGSHVVFAPCQEPLQADWVVSEQEAGELGVAATQQAPVGFVVGWHDVEVHCVLGPAQWPAQSASVVTLQVIVPLAETVQHAPVGTNCACACVENSAPAQHSAAALAPFKRDWNRIWKPPWVVCA